MFSRKSARLGFGLIVGELAVGQVLSPDGWSVEAQETAAIEDSVDDGVSEIVVVQDLAPALRMLVGREEHGAPANVALVDHVVQHVGCVVAVGEVTHLIDE